MRKYNLASATKELSLGIEIEKEHAGTIKKIRDGLASSSPLSDEEIFKLIAEDHLRELPDYYTRLKKMESD